MVALALCLLEQALSVHLVAMNRNPEEPTVTFNLDDGRIVEIRPILPTDAPLLEEGFNQLSETSRFARFGVGMSHLSQDELRYLTDVDQRSHVAWGALVGEEAAGVGRYLTLSDGDSAEIAITVVDRFQRHGLAGLLLQALTAVARHDGLTTFRFEVEPTNLPVLALIRDLAGGYPSAGSDLSEVALANLPQGANDDVFIELIENLRSRTGQS